MYARYMRPESATPDLQRYVRLARRNAWLVLLMVATAVGSAIAISARQEPVYRASMKLVVGQGNSFFQPQFGTSVQPFTQTMTSLLESEIVARTVISDLNLRASPDELLSKLDIKTKPESSVLEVSYESADEEHARDVVDRVGTVFTRLVREKLSSAATADGSAEDGGAPITASVFDPAHVEPTPVSPRPVRNAIFAGAAALVAGLLIAFFREGLDERVRSREDVERWFGAPLFGVIPHVRRRALPSIATDNGVRHNGQFVGALHNLSAKVEFFLGENARPVIVVTSALSAEGKTTVVANLAAALATSGRDVVCVEADVFRPRLAQYFGVETPKVGFSAVLERRADLADGLVDIALHGDESRISHRPEARITTDMSEGSRLGRLRILAADQVGAERAHVVRRDDVGRLLAELRAAAEYVIVDTPPMLVTGNAFPFLMEANAVLVSARMRRTPREAAEAVGQTLASLAIRDVAVVLTDVKAGNIGYDAYGPYAPYEFRDKDSVAKVRPHEGKRFKHSHVAGSSASATPDVPPNPPWRPRDSK